MTVREFLDAVKARVEKATEGPWEMVKEHHRCYVPLGASECDYGSAITEREIYLVENGAWEDAESHVHESYDAHWIAPGVAGNYDYEEGGIILTSDAEFIAHARTDVPRLVAALEAVLEMHRPERTSPPLGDKRLCGNEACDGFWPCPTVQAIESALGGSDDNR